MLCGGLPKNKGGTYDAPPLVPLPLLTSGQGAPKNRSSVICIPNSVVMSVYNKEIKIEGRGVIRNDFNVIIFGISKYDTTILFLYLYYES